MSYPTSQSIHSQIIGAWQLHQFTSTLVSDPSSVKHLLGADPKGIIMYTPDGYMSAQLGAQKEQFSMEAAAKKTDKEWAEIAKGFQAYTGPFSITTTKDGHPLLIHEVHVTNFPPYVGTKQRRLVEIDGDEMVLRPDEPISWEGEQRNLRIVWRRQKKHDPLAGKS